MIKLGITHGDINGISYELILKAFADERMIEICTPVIYGSSKLATYHRKTLDLPAFDFNQTDSAQDIVRDKVNIINCIDDDIRANIGESTEFAGKSSWQAIERAVNDLEAGLIDVLVTSPVDSSNMGVENFKNHADYLEQKFGKQGEKGLTILMQTNLRIALVTRAMTRDEATSQLDQEKITEAAKIFNKSLKRDFKTQRPQIAVLSLTPITSENILGKEETDIIVPTIRQLQSEDIFCFGPYSSEEFFVSAQLSEFDGVLAMYQDQGLAAFRALAVEEGVNYTAGLPIVRTAPAHSVAYKLAGKNEASEDSLRHAIYAAIDIYRARVEYDQAYKNPLQKLYVARGSDNEELTLKGHED